LLHPAKRALAGRGHAVVQTNRPRFELLHQSERATKVARERICAQPEARRIGALDCFLLRVKRGSSQKGSVRRTSF
jgi:hypothetical protein